jgi:hypothetical protein
MGKGVGGMFCTSKRGNQEVFIPRYWVYTLSKKGSERVLRVNSGFDVEPSALTEPLMVLRRIQMVPNPE